MRNYTTKSTHAKPSASNSFRKSDRRYPDAKNTTQEDEKGMATQRNKSSIPKKIISDDVYKPMRTQAILPHQMTTFRYHFATKDPFPSYNDPTCLWFKNLQKAPTSKMRQITFGRTDYVISNWTGDTFPNVIYICMDGLVGFFDINGVPTDKVVAMEIQQISLTMDASNLRTYELRYVLPRQIKWQIPNQLTHIKLSIKIDDQPEPIVLPLPNPMSMLIQINQN